MATKASTKKKKSTKSTAKKKGTAKKPSARSADRADKSVEAFRDALERSVTLSRERIQEIVDDAVKRGRMTRDDANELISKLLARSRKQTEDLLKDLERTLDQARGGVEGRVGKARKQARKQAGKAAGKAGTTARDVADEPLAQADKLRRRANVGSSFPITAYDDLTADQVRGRLADLTKAELRKVRTHEKKTKARKTVLGQIETKLGS